MLLVSLLLVSCGGGGGGVDQNNQNQSGGSGNTGEGQVELLISPVKGPMANARVNVYELDTSFERLFDSSRVLDTGFTDEHAKLTSRLSLPTDVNLVIEVLGGASTDLNTGQAPVVPRLYTFIPRASLSGSSNSSYVTPLSTLGFYMLRERVAEISNANVDLMSEMSVINSTIQSDLPFFFGDGIDIFQTPAVAPSVSDTSQDLFDKITTLRAVNEAIAAMVHESAGTNDVPHSRILEELAVEIHTDRFDSGDISDTANGFDITSFSRNPLDLLVPNTDILVRNISQLIVSEAEIIGIETAYEQRTLVTNIARLYNDSIEMTPAPSPENNAPPPVVEPPVVEPPVAQTPVVETPVISVSNNVSSSSREVTLSVSTNNASIYYTIDGTDPTESSILFTSSFTIVESTTIKARAYLDGYVDSSIASSSIVVVAPQDQQQYLNAPILVSDFSQIGGSAVSRSTVASAFGVSESDVSNPSAEQFSRLAIVERNGRHWMQQRFEHTAGGRNYGLGSTGSQFRVEIPGSNHEEIYVSFDIELPADIVLTRHGKFGPGVLGGPEVTTGGNTSDGYNGFSIRNLFNLRDFGSADSQYPQGTGAIYAYYVDQPNSSGESIPSRIGSVPQLWELGGVTSVQIRVKMNTPETAQGRGDGRKDGILQVWYNGNLVMDLRDMRYRHDNDIHIDDFFYSAFYGGGSDIFSTTKEEMVWFGDIAVSDKPLLYNPPS